MPGGAYNRKVAAILTTGARLAPSGFALAVEGSAAGDGEGVDVFERNPAISAFEIAVDRRGQQCALQIELNRSLAWPLESCLAHFECPFWDQHLTSTL